MAIERWLRLLPGRSHLLLLVVVAAVALFVFGFMDLAVSKQMLQVRHDREVIRVERLEQQNAQLQRELDRAQEGQHLPDRAFEYFNQVPPGTGVVVVEPVPAPEAVPAASPGAETRPFWADLWERLTQP